MERYRYLRARRIGIGIWNRFRPAARGRRFFRAGRCEPPVQGRARARAPRARAPRGAIPGSHGQREPPARAAPISIHLNTFGNLQIGAFGFPFSGAAAARALGAAEPNRKRRASEFANSVGSGSRARLMTLVLVSTRPSGGSRSCNWGPRKRAPARRIGIGEGGHVRGRGAGAASGAREPTDRHTTTAAGGPAGVQPVSTRAVSHTHPSLRKKKLHEPSWRGTTNLWGGAPARAYRRPYTTPSAPAADIAALASAAVSCADSVATTPALATRRMSLCEYSLGSMPRCCILL